MNYPLGALESPPDRRDYPVAMRLARAPVALPPTYRLTLLVSMPQTYDQGFLPSCVNTSFSGMAEFHERKELGTSLRLDDARFYARSKEQDGWPGDGTYPRVALDIWLNEGIYTSTGKGPDHQRLAAYYAVPATEQDIAQVLYQKQAPVSVVLNWPGAWDGMPTTGIAPKLSSSPTYRGLHQLWVWGYDFLRPDHGLLLRNSWSSLWGLRGSFWLGSQAWELSMVGECWFPESRP